MEKEPHWIGHRTAERRQTEDGYEYRDPVNHTLAIKLLLWGAADPLSDGANLAKIDQFVEDLERRDAPAAKMCRDRLNRIRELHKSGRMETCLAHVGRLHLAMQARETIEAKHRELEDERRLSEALERSISRMLQPPVAVETASEQLRLPQADSPPLAGVAVAPATGADGSESAPPTASRRANEAAPAAALPSPVIAAAFDGLNGWNREKWAKYLGDPPKWLGNARVRAGAQGAGDAATWNPVTIAVALSGKGASLSKLDAVFRMRTVRAWSAEWEDRRELLSG